MQQASKGYQQNNHERDQEETWRIHREVGQEIAKYFVGLSDHTIKSNERNALLFGFRIKVVIPLEVGLATIRTEAYDASHNEEVLARDLDLIEEKRENAFIRMANYQK